MNDKPTDDIIREVYAKFGLAYYLSECLHKNLCQISAFYDLPSRDFITSPRVDERLAVAYSLTLGILATKLENVLPADLNNELQKAVKTRNFLAHDFWYERAHLMYSTTSVCKLINELGDYVAMFGRLDDRFGVWSKPMFDELGLTDDLLLKASHRILAGESEDPLPNIKSVREMEKKLSIRQQLIRVWEYNLDDERRPMIFELADGSLWQLSDVGLGWTRSQEIGPTWTEHPLIKPFLPAYILPRPKSKAAWEYEFILGDGAILWVKPVPDKQTFQCGVRIRKRADRP